jgi:PAS domain S-box-containing protein
LHQATRVSRKPSTQQGKRVIELDIQRIFRGMPGLFLVVKPDPGFTIVAASDDYLRATHTDFSIVGRPLFEVFPDNPALAGASAVDSLRASLQRVVASRAAEAMPIQRYDVRLPPALGRHFQERYWAPVNAPLLTDAGEVEYIVHRVDDASAKANRQATEILESITEGFFTLDRNWRFNYVNREAHRILDRQPGDLAGKVLWDEYPGLIGTRFEQNYRHTMVQREKGAFTDFYPDHQRWYEVTTFPAPEGISVYFRDVTERMRFDAERDQLVAESERQRRIYETALDSTPDFVYVFDLDHRALYANDALLKTWGVDDVRGKKWMDLGYEQWHADLHDREIEQVIATRAPIRGEIPFTGTNGTRIYDYIFAPVIGPDGDVVAVAGTTRDITERQAVEQAVRVQAARLADSDRAKDEFLATLSHELRNPLAPLRNSIELLRRLGDGGQGTPAIHAMMERQVNHLVRLVDDLLEVSRISRGTFSLRTERVELADVVRNALETTDALIKGARHDLRVELPEERLWVDGDQVRLAQILANLLNNAANYTEEGGHIVLRAWRDGDSAAISVRDDGLGIDPGSVPRMFEMFSRGNRYSGRSQAGLGIGLALSRRLAEMHHGTLDAHSEGPGKGSEFVLRVPLAVAAAMPGPVESDSPRLDGIRVLVVDDNHDAADSICMILDVLGAEVAVARDGKEALALFPSFDPAVVLLDIGMPGMNGYEVARAIRTRFPESHAMLVALTGWGHDDDRQRAREAGFNHHLVKPAEIGALMQLLGAAANDSGVPSAQPHGEGTA